MDNQSVCENEVQSNEAKARAKVEANKLEYMSDFENFKKISDDDAYVAAAILAGLTMTEFDHHVPHEWNWIEGISLDDKDITESLLTNCAVEALVNYYNGVDVMSDEEDFGDFDVDFDDDDL